MTNKTILLKTAMDELLAALRELLSPRQYEAYWLYEIEGLSGNEIGKYSAICGNCYCATAWEISKENAVFDWNGRADHGTD